MKTTIVVCILGLVAFATTACNSKGACIVGAGTEFEACTEDTGKSACESGKGQTFHSGATCASLGYTKGSAAGGFTK